MTSYLPLDSDVKLFRDAVLHNLIVMINEKDIFVKNAPATSISCYNARP